MFHFSSYFSRQAIFTAPRGSHECVSDLATAKNLYRFLSVYLTGPASITICQKIHCRVKRFRRKANRDSEKVSQIKESLSKSAHNKNQPPFHRLSADAGSWVALYWSFESFWITSQKLLIKTGGEQPKRLPSKAGQTFFNLSGWNKNRSARHSRARTVTERGSMI